MVGLSMHTYAYINCYSHAYNSYKFNLFCMYVHTNKYNIVIIHEYVGLLGQILIQLLKIL